MKHHLTGGLLALGLALPTAMQAQDYFSIGSCPVTCTAYTWSAGITDVINQNVEGVEATAEETAGYIANIALIQNGEMEAAMATSLSAFEAYTATGNYAGTEPGKIMAWMSIAPVAMHVITLEGSGIETLEDLAGKRIGMGQPGGVSMLDADIVMARVAGEDFEPFRVRLGDMLDMLGDGNLDAALWNGSFPLAPVIQLAANNDLKLIPIGDDFLADLQSEYPPYFRLSIPGGTYDDVAEDVPTFGLANALVVSSDVSEDRVYEMTKAIMENLDTLAGVHPAFAGMSAETVLDGFASPLHPGALRYYREIGVPGIEEYVARTGG